MIGIKFSASKKLKLTLPNIAELEQMGQIAWRIMEERVTQRGLDSDGKPLPPLAASGKKIMTVPYDDPRFLNGAPSWRYSFVDGSGVRHWRTVPEADRAGRTPPSRVFTSYAQSKSARGAAAKGDGKLTGAMWASKSLQVKVEGDDVLLRWYFRGSSVTVGTRKTAKGTVKPAKIDNYLKAASFISRNPDGSRSWTGPKNEEGKRQFKKMFDFVRPTKEEWDFLLRFYRAATEIRAE